MAASGYELRNPYARRYGNRAATEKAEKTFAYEQEDQSATGVRIGARVRHKQFGVGTVLQVEDQGDDLKITVRFPAVGTKKLLARYAGLEPA
jgi:hypothetical protein